MGANSSVHDNRSPVATVTAGPAAFPTACYEPAANNWYSSFPESRAPAPPVFAPNYKYSVSNNNGHAALPERRATPAAVSSPYKAANTNKIIAFHSSTSWRAYFDANKVSNKLIVMYFTATWCGPCRHMEPSLNEFAAKYTEAEFVKIDVDELLNVSSEYRVQTMPTFIFMKKGKEIDRVVGARKEELQRKIEIHRI